MTFHLFEVEQPERQSQICHPVPYVSLFAKAATVLIVAIENENPNAHIGFRDGVEDNGNSARLTHPVDPTMAKCFASKLSPSTQAGTFGLG